MVRARLSRSNQSWPVWLVLRAYEFSASLKLAVVLILASSAVLAFATFVESHLGTAAARYYVYQAWWFVALNGLLAWNIFCAAAIRYPWKRHQTGFVVVHIGLLILLFGSAYSFRNSVNAQLLVYRGSKNNVAVDIDAIGEIILDGLPGRADPLRVPFRPSPFNWADEEPWKRVREFNSLIGLDDSSKPWQHAPVELYSDSASGLKIEVVDYYSKSERLSLPYAKLNFEMPAMGMQEEVPLEYDDRLKHASSPFPRGGGGRFKMGDIFYWRTADPEYVKGIAAFRTNRSVGDDGAVVVYHAGECHTLSVNELREQQSTGKPLELDSTLAVELVEFVLEPDLEALFKTNKLKSAPSGFGQVLPIVELKLSDPTAPNTSAKRILRIASFPFARIEDLPPGTIVDVYHPSMQGRVDIVEGPKGELAYRVWQQGLKLVSESGRLEKDAEPVTTWSMGGGERVWKMSLSDFRPRPESGDTNAVFPLPFDKDDRGVTRRIKVRVSWSDSSKPGGRNSDEFWLSQNAPEPWQSERSHQIHETRLGDNSLRTQYVVNQIDVGFTVRLDDFDLKMDPGARTASNYTSLITIFDFRRDDEIQAAWKKARSAESASHYEAAVATLRNRESTLLKKAEQETSTLKVGGSDPDGSLLADGLASQHIITMNRPLDYPDLRGRTLRLFQENYVPPQGDQDLASVFRVNYDPGRWIKYLGSLLICVGIFLMFYMKAYFFSKPKKPTETEAGVSPAPKLASSVS